MGLRTTSDMKATASLIWLLSNIKENWVSSRVTVTSTLPPKESIRRSISSLENLEVPFKASREMNWETELLSRSSCRVPAFIVTVIAAPWPGQYWEATRTPLESFLRLLGLRYLRASGI